MKMTRGLSLGLLFALALSACANRDGTPKTTADMLIFDRLEERQAQTKDQIDMMRFKCNLVLSNYDRPIFSPEKKRYISIEEKQTIKDLCEKRFGVFPNNNYVLSDERINELRASGVLPR